MLQEDAMQKLSKTVMRPRYPREWLGRDTVDGIRRLVTSSSIGHVEDRCIKSMPHRGGVREWGGGGTTETDKQRDKGEEEGWWTDEKRARETHTHTEMGGGGRRETEEQREKLNVCVGGGGRRDVNTQTGSRRPES